VKAAEAEAIMSTAAPAARSPFFLIILFFVFIRQFALPFYIESTKAYDIAMLLCHMPFQMRWFIVFI
jgi:hypothetical protein